jgi:hypothetical protein
MVEDMFDDPVLLDDDDPESTEETFKTFQEMGTKPSEIANPKYRAEYAEWLNKNK